MITLVLAVKIWGILVVLFCAPLVIFPKTDERLRQEIAEEDEIERQCQAWLAANEVRSEG